MSGKTVAIIGGSIAALAAITGVFIWIKNKDDEETVDPNTNTDPVNPNENKEDIDVEVPLQEWPDLFDPTIAPPAPQFDVAADTQACQSVINQYYQTARQLFETTEGQKQALANAYAGILEAQASSQVEIVNNEDFLYWTLSDWDTTWLAQNGFPKPGFSEKMLKTLVPEFLGLPAAEPVRNQNQLDEVVGVVYQFRLNQGLE